MGITEDPQSHKILLTFVEKIRDLEAQEFAGFVVLKVNVEVLNEITTATGGLGKTEESYLIDKTFFVLTPLKQQKDGDRTLEIPAPAIAGCFGSKGQTAIYENYADKNRRGKSKEPLVPQTYTALISNKWKEIKKSVSVY